MAKKKHNLGLSYSRDGAFIRLVGRIDEFAELAPLLAEIPPLRLNMAQVITINSLGLQRWLRFIKEYGTQTLEFHQCPVDFIDAVNMVPQIIAPSGNMRRIKSVIIPFSCVPCRQVSEVTVAINTLTRDKKDVVEAPTVLCNSCASPMQPDTDLNDHFLFLTITDTAESG